MSPPRTLGFACADAGGTRALIPVARALAESSLPVRAWVAGAAASIWPDECAGVSHTILDDATPAEAVRAVLRDAGVVLLVSGCGLYNRLEHTVRGAARSLGLDCVGVLDAWLNYAERFERSEGGSAVRHAPDHVCAPDGESAAGLRAAGFDADAVSLTGSPAMEEAVQRVGAAVRVRDALRREHGLRSDRPLLVFCSDPFRTGPDGAYYSGPGALVDERGRSLFGYDAAGTLAQLLGELDAVDPEGAVQVAVKTHPSEYAGDLEPILKAHPKRATRLVEGGSPRDWLAMADLVCGMISAVLTEAALAGRPTLSVQIGLRDSGAADPCLASHLGLCHAAFDLPSLRAHLARFHTGGGLPPISRPAAFPVEGATRRVCALVTERWRAAAR